MTIAIQIITILFMLTLMFIGIWSFILANKSYNQLKYKNYLLEKVASQLAIMTENSLLPDKKAFSDDSTEAEPYFIKEEILNITKEINDLPPLFELEKEK